MTAELTKTKTICVVLSYDIFIHVIKTKRRGPNGHTKTAGSSSSTNDNARRTRTRSIRIYHA